MMGTAAGVAASLAIGAAGCQEQNVTMAKATFLTYGSERFYNPDGSFNAEKAREAYFEMMRYYNYPVPDVLKTEQFWVCDFMQRDYARLGMGGIFWVNARGAYGDNGAKAYKGDWADKSYGYLGHEIYLLPGQMLPEHHHIGGADGYGPKMESWQVRYGEVEFFGEYKGAGSETLISDMPKKDQPWGSGQDWFKSKYVIKRTAKSGELYTLQDPESWHFQRAGKTGAIVTEYGTYHNHVTFSKPGMEFASSAAS
jgi:hypothetical protein